MNLHLSLHVDLEKTEPVLVVDNEFPWKSSEPISLGLGKNDLVMKVGWSIVDGGVAVAVAAILWMVATVAATPLFVAAILWMVATVAATPLFCSVDA